MKRTTTEIFEDHLARRLKGDVDGDIKANFSKEVVILSSFGTFKGHDGVRRSAELLAREVGDAIFAYDHTIIDGAFAFLEWTASSNDVEVCDGADSFVIKDGKIIMQTAHYTAKPQK